MMASFDTRHYAAIDVMYICRMCTLILRDPVQLLCGHRYCQSCANDEKEVFIKCMQCNKETLKKEIFLDRGFKNDMKTLNIICSLCAWNGMYQRYQDHLDKFHGNIICNACNDKFGHHKTSCENMLVRCDLYLYGCNEQILRKDSSKHYLTAKHQLTILNILTDSKLFDSQKKIPFNQCNENNVSITVQRLLDKLNEFSKNVQILHCNIKQILFPISAYKTSIEERTPPGDSLPQKQDDIISYDGTLLWKIDRIKSTLNDNQSFITSQPFYTSPNGYKMCVRLYLNVDGIGQKTHLSIFLVLMRGEYDAILTWPFRFQVTFCLYDLINQRNHIIQSFSPDTKSRSFQRPQAEMNIGSGISQFIPRLAIQQENSPYVADDSIYIRIMVRQDPLPTFILPDIMNINPGLPVNLLQDKIQEAVEKYQIQPFKLTLSLKSQQ